MGTRTRAKLVGWIVFLAFAGGLAWLVWSHQPVAARAALDPPLSAQRVFRPTSDPAGPIVVVVIDTLRADHLDAYGYGLPTGECLARVLERSTRFERCYAASSWTSPSTATLLTGLMPPDHGIRVHGDTLPEACQTLPEVLREAGWGTFGVSHNKNVSRKTNFHQGFERFEDATGKTVDYPDVELMVDVVGGWIDELARKPSFLYLQPMNCHGPYKVPAGSRACLLGREPNAEFVYYKGPMAALVRERRLEARADVSTSYVESLTEQYDTAIRYCLDQLGQMFAELDRVGLLDPALVVITADHGEELYDHGGFSHGYTLFEECIRVPLFVKLPGQREAGVVADRVALLDLVPTLLAHAGIVAEPALPGESLLPLCVDGSDANGLRARLAERALVARTHWPKRLQGEALISGTYKLIAVQSSWQHEEPATMLFDLAADPHEREDLAAREPRLVDDLTRALARAARRTDPCAQSETINVRAAFQTEELEALGY